MKLALLFALIALSAAQNTTQYKPVVFMHGMGDFADNPLGMIPFRNLMSKHLNTYVTNAKLGSWDISDQMGEFFQTMWTEVDSFADFVRADPKLKDGFNAVGLSQGNLIIRGYVEKYNSPKVHNFVSIHGIMLGVAGFPHCDMDYGVCDMIDQLLGGLAYTSLAQNVLAQANYYRDTTRINDYLAGNNFLPDLNNERNFNQTFKDNFASLDSLALVMAEDDTMVWPRESEHFGFFKDGSQTEKLTMNQTDFYQKDLFGLKTLDEAGKIDFYSTPGDHLQFTEAFLLQMCDKYFTN